MTTSAAQSAADGSAPAPEPGRHRLRLLVRWLFVSGLLLILVRIFVFDPYAIPTGSMRPTIIEGDVVLVNKLPYTIRSIRSIPFTDISLPTVQLPGLGHLERGDVVVFEYPHLGGNDPAEGTQYVKRCVALRGDTVRLVDGRIHVNGREVAPAPNPDNPGDTARARRPAISRNRVIRLLRDGAAVIVPYVGCRVEMDSVTAELWRPWIESEGVSVAYRNNIVVLAGLPATHYVFRRDYFFALGDNAVVSRDSRVFGFVPYENLIGTPLLVYWSRDPIDGAVRWERIGTLIR